MPKYRSKRWHQSHHFCFFFCSHSLPCTFYFVCYSFVLCCMCVCVCRRLCMLISFMWLFNIIVFKLIPKHIHTHTCKLSIFVRQPSPIQMKLIACVCVYVWLYQCVLKLFSWNIMETIDTNNNTNNKI